MPSLPPFPAALQSFVTIVVLDAVFTLYFTFLSEDTSTSVVMTPKVLGRKDVRALSVFPAPAGEER